MASLIQTLPSLDRPILHTAIDSLPPELLDDVFSLFPTPALLPLAAVNHLFHDVIARLLYRRLRRAVASHTHELILECYHPSAKISTPYLHCAYMGTDGLDQATDGIDDVPGSTLLRLPNMYSRFRPMPHDDRDAHVRNYRAIRRTMSFFMYSEASAGTPGTSAITSSVRHRGRKGAGEDESLPLVSSDVYLDDSELFSQLCTVTSLVKTGPRRGLFLGCACINNGVIRVWRDWLSRRNDARISEQRGKAKGRGARAGLTDPKQDAVLWAYTGKHVGMRFRVTDTTVPSETAPAPGAASDDVPVSYQLEYEGMFSAIPKLDSMANDSHENGMS